MGKALKLKPNAPEVLSNYGNVLKTEGRFAEALASYDKALAAKPDYVATLAKRAMVLRDLGRLDDSVESHRRSIELDPTFVSAHNNLANVLRDLGRLDEAEATKVLDYLRQMQELADADSPPPRPEAS